MKTTHIGSLPYLSIEEAIAFNEGLTLPALPTIPKLYDNEWMINQFSSGFMKSDHELPFSCFNQFIERFKGKIKVQVCGIQTLYNNSTKDFEKDAFKHWYLLVVKRFLKRIPNEYILFFDEPDLRDLDNSLWEIYREFEVERGIHCCAKVDWKMLDLSYFPNISFDSSMIDIEDIELLRRIKKDLFFGNIDTRTGVKTMLTGQLKTDHDFESPACGLALTSNQITKKIQGLLTC